MNFLTPMPGCFIQSTDFIRVVPVILGSSVLAGKTLLSRGIL